MPYTPREPSSSPAGAPSLLRSSLIAVCALAQAAWPLATNAADTQAVRTQLQRPLILNAGTQQELLIDKGIERMAIADEAVAAVTVTRKTPSSPAARLIITGKAAGRTTLMVWEKGNAAATTYAVEVRRRNATVSGAMDSVAAHQQARDTALAGAGDKTELVDRSIVNVRSNTVQVEVKVVEFNRSVLKQAGLNIFSTRAMPLPSRKPTFSPIPALPKLNRRLKACARGLLYSPLILPSDAKVADFSDDGVKEPKLNPLELARVLKMFRPACLSTLRLNSTTFTST